MSRGDDTKKKGETRLLNFWAHKRLIRTLDRAVVLTDLDRSKFIRQAIREKAQRHGLTITEAA